MADGAGRALLSLEPESFGLSLHLCRDVRMLDRLLGEVVQEQEGDKIVNLVRRLYQEAPEMPAGELLSRMPELKQTDVAQKVARAYTILFQLLNTAEQKEIVRVNRNRQPRPESIRDSLEKLAKRGLSSQEIRRLFEESYICPTLTAHPTEARRRSVLNKLDRIAGALGEVGMPTENMGLDRPLDNQGLAEIVLKRNLVDLWQTDELRVAKFTVEQEAKNTLHFFEHSVFDVVSWLRRDLLRAWRDLFPEDPEPPHINLTYRSWVGGDRDGNPNVTPEVTWKTILQESKLAVQSYLRSVDQLRKEITHGLELEPDDPLRLSIKRDLEELEIDDYNRSRYAHEPYALKLVAIRQRLRGNLAYLNALETDLNATRPPHAYANSKPLLEDLVLLQTALVKHRAQITAETGLLTRLERQVESFGFRLASLDIRQHSNEHAPAVEELLQAAGVLGQGESYVDLDEAAKVELLTQELRNPRPLVPQRWAGSEDTEGVREVFRVVRRAHEKIGRNVIQAYVISMTHGVSDVLEVLLLAKDAGIVTYREGEITSDVDVVPLLETIQDLANSEELLRELVASDVYQQVLASRGGLQEIMLGYSDSSKDGGYLAANASLYETQDRLSKFARENDLKVRFFHGRGGTVGRGGGRANRAILSQPPGSFSGQIRFTEQGEVISFRYGMPPIAHRHLEQIVGAVITASARHGKASTDPEAWRDALGQLAERSREVYRDFVYENEEFWPFYAQATPIARISHLPIASRPVMRPGKALVGMEGLRAIPWNFAWVQSRYMVPGWFGLGSALAWFTQQDEANLELLREMYGSWPFFKTAIENAELELARAEMDTARRYANRVDDPELGRRMHERVEKEYHESVRQVEEVTERPLLEHARIVRSTIEFRNPLVLPLNELQVGLAELWDDRESQDREIEPDLREATLQTMAGIAAAMQSTG